MLNKLKIISNRIFKLNYPKFWQSINVLSYFLIPFSIVYWFSSFLRHLFIKPIKLPCKVICIGNITIGGTGKTQAVIWLSQFLKQQKINFIIISKGYMGKFTEPTIVSKNCDSSYVGDEACELSKYGKVVVCHCPSQAISIIEKLNPDVIIMDDGMQNPRIYKDFTIMVVDGSRYFGNMLLIPAGPLRQSVMSGLVKSDAVIVVHPNPYISLHHNKVFEASIKSVDNILPLDKKYFAFTAIGNPNRFFHTLEQENINVVKTMFFPDHYQYTTKDLEELQNSAKDINSTLITTRKDYVKIPKEFQRNILCFNVKLEVTQDQELLKLIYEKTINKNKI